MNDYPDICVARDGYTVEVDDGSSLSRAEDGTPHIQRFFSQDRFTFTVRHPMLEPAKYEELIAFYAANKNSYVRYTAQDTGKVYEVLMLSPPRPVDSRAGLITYEMRMTGSLAA